MSEEWEVRSKKQKIRVKCVFYTEWFFLIKY